MPEKEEEEMGYYEKRNQGADYVTKGIQENKGKKEENFRKAIKYLDDAISINPYDHLSHFNKGVAFYNLGEYKEAEDCFSRSEALNESVAGRYYEGLNKMELGKLEEAKEILERSLELTSEKHVLRKDIEEKYSEVEKRLEEEKESKKELDEELEELEEESEEI